MAAGSILNNVSAISASRTLGITQAGLDKTIGRLTTGMRINKAQDDAAGLAISNRLGADIRVSAQARRNAYDGIAYLQVADGALDEVTNLLTRASELAEQARTGTISSTNRQALNLEFQVIKLAIYDVGVNAKFNGQSVFNDKELFAAVADFSNIDIKIGTMVGNIDGATAVNKNDVTFTTTAQFGTKANILTSDGAAAAKKLLDQAIQDVSMQRASIGATQQYLTTIANTLGIQTENFTAANSQIRDANIADEVINLTKFQILTQSGISSLAQSNQAAQSLLGLLR